MWDAEVFIAKAKMYMEEADDLKQDSEIHALLLLLGLEFLLRAPLAKRSPLLLAESKSMMDAAGFPKEKGGARSIATNEVIDRLGLMVDKFGVVSSECRMLIELRNREVHSSDRPFSIQKPSAWLPQFLSIVDVMSRHLGMGSDDFLSAEIQTRAAALRTENDERVRTELTRKIERSKAIFAALSQEEIAARMARRAWHRARPLVPTEGGYRLLDADEESKMSVTPPAVRCPACKKPADATYRSLRQSRGRVVDENIEVDIYYVFERFDCVVCGLVVEGTGEASAASFSVEYKSTELSEATDYFAEAIEAAMEDRYASEYMDE